MGEAQGNIHNRGKQTKRGRRLFQTLGPTGGVAKQQKAKGHGEKKVAHVKCYKRGKIKVTSLEIHPLFLLNYTF